MKVTINDEPRKVFLKSLVIVYWVIMHIHYAHTHTHICIILYNHLEDNFFHLYVWCICVCGDQKLIDVGCLPSSSLPYCFESGSLIDLGASDSHRLASQQAPGVAYLHLLSAGLQGHAVVLGFLCVDSGPVLTQQTLYWLSHLPSPNKQLLKIIFKNYFCKCTNKAMRFITEPTYVHGFVNFSSSALLTLTRAFYLSQYPFLLSVHITSIALFSCQALSPLVPGGPLSSLMSHTPSSHAETLGSADERKHIVHSGPGFV